MRVTIIADDGSVGVDGVFRSVDLSTLDVNIHAVQWDGDFSLGHIEFKDRSPEQEITDISSFQFLIDAWTAAAPLPLTLSELKQLKKAEFKVEGVVRISAQIPEWNDFDLIALLASVWNMFGGTPNASQSLAKDIYLYVRDTALSKVSAVVDQAGLDAIDPTAADPFGDGTSWPT